MALDDASRPSQVKNVLFTIGIFVVFLQAGFYASQQKSGKDANLILPGDVVVDHPIPRLMADAEDKFRKLLERQSKSLAQAVAEYKRRYGRDPPRGFDDWYAFAVDKDIKIIDDYDAIWEDLEPFWSFDGPELRRRVDQVSCTLTLIECVEPDGVRAGRSSAVNGHGPGAKWDCEGDEHEAKRGW